jgi:hypothetical protein
MWLKRDPFKILAAATTLASISGQSPGEGASLLGAHRDRQDVDDPRHECQGPDHVGLEVASACGTHHG